MKRRGALYEIIKCKNPELADTIRKEAGSARSPGSPPNRSAGPAKSGTSTQAYDPQVGDRSSPEPAAGPQHQEHSSVNSQSRYKGSPRTERPIVDAYIGLDFGTSCSKVVIRLPDQRRLFAVPFGQLGHPSNRYLSPSVIWCSPKRECLLQGSDGSTKIQNLKMALLAPNRHGAGPSEEMVGSFSAEVGSAAYLAELLKLIRSWFNATHGNTYGTDKIRWWCNIGVPAKPYSDYEVCQRFARVAHAAWKLQDIQVPLTVDLIESTLLEFEDKQSIVDLSRDEIIQAVPEVLAAVGGYIKSGATKDGPHILMDVGAGTLDMCSFRIIDNRGDLTCIMLSTSIAPLGSISLERRRMKALIDSVEHCAKSDGFAFDPVKPIRLHPMDYLPTKDQLTEIHHSVSSAEIQFGEDCGAELQNIWKALRNKRDPNYSGEIPFVLCGGGSRLPVYDHLVDSISLRMREQMTYGQLQRVNLRNPSNLASDLPEDQLHRYSVAVGLSYPTLELGKIIRPQDVPDIPAPPRPDWGTSFVSKDQV